MILPERRNRLVLRVEEVVRVERVVPEELEQRAAQRIRAGARGDVDQRRRLAAELRRILRLLDLEFLNRVDRRIDDEVVEQLVGHLHAVEHVDVVTGALPADVRQRTRLLQCVTARAARRDDDRVAQLREREEVAAIEWKLHDLLVLDDVADLRVGRLQQRVSAVTLTLLGQAPDLEREVQRQRLSQLHDNTGPDDTTEPGEIDGDHVHADPHRHQKIPPDLVGDLLDTDTTIDVFGDHASSRQHTALSVTHDTGDLAGVCLCRDCCRENRETQECTDTGPKMSSYWRRHRNLGVNLTPR